MPTYLNIFPCKLVCLFDLLGCNWTDGLKPPSSFLRPIGGGLLKFWGRLRTGLGGGLENGRPRLGGGGVSRRLVPKTRFSNEFKKPPVLEAALEGTPLLPPPMKFPIVLKRLPLFEVGGLPLPKGGLPAPKFSAIEAAT